MRIALALRLPGDRLHSRSPLALSLRPLRMGFALLGSGERTRLQLSQSLEIEPDYWQQQLGWLHRMGRNWMVAGMNAP